MKYVVTGAGGFAGRHLVGHLAAAGHEVVPLGRAEADLLDAPAVADFLARAAPDGIFHLAAPETSVGHSWSDPAGTLDRNLESTLSVLEAARALDPKPRVLFVSSAEVVGNVPESDQPLAEDAPVHPESPYALSKHMGEAAARFYTEEFGVPTLTVRAFNHIGPGQRESFVIPNFARQIARIEASAGPGELQVGNLEARRDFSDVRDVVGAYLVVMERGQAGELYHVGSGTAHRIRDLLDRLLKLSPATIKVVVDRGRFRPTDIDLLVSDPAKVQKLGWKAKITLDQTLSDILEEARKEIRAS